MKQLAKRILSFAIALCLSVLGVVTMPMVNAKAASANYQETSFGVGKMLITTTYNGSTYYLPTTATSSKVPVAEPFTNANDIDDTNLWTITDAGNGQYYIQNNDGNYLYTTNSNDGVRVSKTNNAWIYDDKANSFKDAKTSRFLGIYSGADWRCYTTVNQGNYKESSTSFKFYKVVENNVAVETPLNEVKSTMSLAYQYKTKTETVSEVIKTDTLNRGTTGVTSTSYSSWSGKQATSSAVYAGQSAGDNESIQLRSSNSNSGVITTTSGGKVKKIVVVWNSSTANGRTLNVYGSKTAYTSPTDLYNTSKDGDELGTIKYGTSTELVIEGDYEYIGFRSSSGALYLTSVEITWSSTAQGGSVEQTVYYDSEFRIRCGVEASVSEIANVDAYGICVKANKSVLYTEDGAAETVQATSWTTEGNIVYVVISLGDIINDLDKLEMEFTVQAFVKVGDTVYYSSESTTYSVATMIKTYYEEKDIQGVKDLYNYLFGEEV